MSGTVTELAYQPTSALLPPVPADFDWDHYYDTVVTEDDEPVDSLYAEKLIRLLPDILYASWTPPVSPGQAPRDFLAAGDVGIFREPSYTAVAPDFFLSLDVKPRYPIQNKRSRSYFMREYGKPPDLVIEIVSPTPGGEMEEKPGIYADLGVRYYVVYDTVRRYGKKKLLHTFELKEGLYQPRTEPVFPDLGLGLTLWEGVLEQIEGVWLRWTSHDGELIPLPMERAAWAEDLAAQETLARRQAENRARQATLRATKEADRAARLAEKLRALGIDPEQD